MQSLVEDYSMNRTKEYQKGKIARGMDDKVKKEAGLAEQLQEKHSRNAALLVDALGE